MPKRKSKDYYEYLRKKLRKLERKIRRKTRCDSSSSGEFSNVLSDKEDNEMDIGIASMMEISDIEVNTSPDHVQILRSEVVIPNPQSEQPICTEEAETLVLDTPGTSVATDVNAKSQPEPEEPEQLLDNDVLEILGIDPTSNIKFGKDINNDLAVRLQHYATAGLTKEARKELCDKYLIPSNCKIIDAPLLNPEIKAAVSEQLTKRDKHIESKQKQVAAALSCLSDALTSLFSSKSKDTNLIRSLMDASRLLCDNQYQDSITRRNFILSSLKKELTEQLQNTKVDSFLFGENLPDTLRAAKAISKSGAELKANPPARQFVQKKQIPGSSKNWKAPFPNKKPPAAATQKARESTTQKRQPSSSYKQSRHQQSNKRR